MTAALVHQFFRIARLGLSPPCVQGLRGKGEIRVFRFPFGKKGFYNLCFFPDSRLTFLAAVLPKLADSSGFQLALPALGKRVLLAVDDRLRIFRGFPVLVAVCGLSFCWKCFQKDFKVLSAALSAYIPKAICKKIIL